jgi:hypothetical protein
VDPLRIEQRIASLQRELGQYFGHRTLWVDDDGTIVHAEPELELEAVGWRYVATLMRPDRETLTAALMRVMPAPPLPAIGTPVSDRVAELVPAAV